MNEWDVSKSKSMQSWIKFLEKYNVFFSAPLDLDFLMLEHYGDKYKEIVEDSEGPYVPEKGKIIKLEKEEEPCAEYEERVDDGVHCTLKKCGGDGSTYTKEQKQLMIWYNYLFLNRGKPSTHILALSNMEKSDLLNNIPPVIKKILKTSEEILLKSSED